MATMTEDLEFQFRDHGNYCTVQVHNGGEFKQYTFATKTSALGFVSGYMAGAEAQRVNIKHGGEPFTYELEEDGSLPVRHIMI